MLLSVLLAGPWQVQPLQRGVSLTLRWGRPHHVSHSCDLGSSMVAPGLTMTRYSTVARFSGRNTSLSIRKAGFCPCPGWPGMCPLLQSFTFLWIGKFNLRTLNSYSQLRQGITAYHHILLSASLHWLLLLLSQLEKQTQTNPNPLSFVSLGHLSHLHYSVAWKLIIKNADTTIKRKKWIFIMFKHFSVA